MDLSVEVVVETPSNSRNQLREITHFFDVYRDLDPGRHVRSDGHDKAEVARQVLEASRSAQPPGQD